MENAPHEFLTLIDQEDMENPSVDNHSVDWLVNKYIRG